MAANPEKNNDLNINFLREHVQSNPGSPLFARLADGYLEMGNPGEALKVLLEGLRTHPDYVTAHFILAKTYLSLRRYRDAREELNMVVRMLPTCAPAYELLDRSRELELNYPPVDQVEIEESTAPEPGEELPEPRRKGRRKSNRKDLIPGEELFTKPGSRTLAPPPKKDPAVLSHVESISTTLDIESLAMSLENARIPVIKESDLIPERREVDEKKVDLEKRPVTETLAKIYTQQEKYKEAIIEYERLIMKNPERAEYYRSKIRELKRKESDTGPLPPLF
ncbi:MAG: tetratricopeptide repeat protein [Chlorobi bacterium]|nr:tetratricopeptide repeat protein [Chlorobiota bacterium]